jgi:hypothetical protein
MFDFDLVEMVENNMEQKQNTVPPVDEFKGNPIGLVPPSLAAFSAVIIAAVFHFLLLSATEELVVLAGITQLNIASFVRIKSATVLTVQAHIVILRQTLCILAQSVPQNIVRRIITHSLLKGSARVNASAPNKAKSFINQFHLSFVHWDYLLDFVNQL